MDFYFILQLDIYQDIILQKSMLTTLMVSRSQLMDNNVWSFVARCNCSHTANNPSIIGQDYTCDGEEGDFNFVEILWASQKCGENSTKVLLSTSNDIELKICHDENRNDDDLEINTIKLSTVSRNWDLETICIIIDNLAK